MATAQPLLAELEPPKPAADPISMSWSVAHSIRNRNVHATHTAHHPPALSTPAHHGFSATGWVSFFQPSLKVTLPRVRHK